MRYLSRDIFSFALCAVDHFCIRWQFSRQECSTRGFCACVFRGLFCTRSMRVKTSAHRVRYGLRNGPRSGSTVHWYGENESVMYISNGTVHTDHAPCRMSRNGTRNGFYGIALGAIWYGLGHGSFHFWQITFKSFDDVASAPPPSSFVTCQNFCEFCAVNLSMGFTCYKSTREHWWKWFADVRDDGHFLSCKLLISFLFAHSSMHWLSRVWLRCIENL